MEDTSTSNFNWKKFYNEGPNFDFMKNIMFDCDILFIQEYGLNKSQFNKLATLGGRYGVEAKNSMDESVIRKGRPKGGCAVLTV